MKRILPAFVALIFFLGCESSNEIDKSLLFRDSLIKAQSCTFTATITADYGSEMHQFTVDCISDKHGTLSFSVIEPKSIAGVSGTITETDCHLTFDDKLLVFPPLADGQITPITAPWLLLKALREGYISGAESQNDMLHIAVDDSYEENPILLDVWIVENNVVRGEILYKGRRILSVDVENFELK